jgi:hypothetical protein
MKNSRRHFLTSVLKTGLAATLPLSACRSDDRNIIYNEVNSNYAKLDEIIKNPVFRRELFPIPVIIDKLELLRYKNTFLCRVRSKDGAEGISVGHSGQLRSLYPVFTNLLQPSFINKDARDLDVLIEKVYI